MFKNFRENQQNSSERSLLEAKICDKYKFAMSKNKITNTDFLNMTELKIVEKFLKENKINEYIIFGGCDAETDRNIIIFYNSKFTKEMVEKNYSKILQVIRIENPKELNYEHRNYLSAIMKLGIKREKIGDIFVREDGADIVVLTEVASFLKDNLQTLTRFKRSKCDIINIKDIKYKEKEFEEIKIIVSSMRLDNFVSELAKTSRNKALEIINEQKVFVDYELETKFSKKINLGNTINIRGKGKFIVEEIHHKTKNNKFVVVIKKYV